MDLTQTQTQTNTPAKNTTTPATANEPDQSVYISDQDMVKTYPVSMSNDQIDFDLHTTVRGKTPEDYFVNFLPLKEIQTAFKDIVFGGPIGKSKQLVKVATDVLKEGFKIQDQEITPAFKYAVTGNIEDAYKPWLDLWKESGQSDKVMTATRNAMMAPLTGKLDNQVGSNEEFMATAPPAISAIPWFMAEFIPDQLLEFGTKPFNWIGSYGVEKFGPPLINKAVQSKWNQGATQEISAFFQKLFKGEEALKAEFDFFGIQPNTKTTEVKAAFDKFAQVAHPDKGGNPEEFMKGVDAYKKILSYRGKAMEGIFDFFRSSDAAVTPKSSGVSGLLTNEKGSANLTPFSNGDLVKFGKEVGQVLKLSGEIAVVNVAGKAIEVPINKLTAIPKEPSIEEPSVNMERMTLSPEARLNLVKATDVMKEEIQNQTGKPITHEEVIAKAKEAEIISKGVSREATLEFQASLLKTRQHLAALAEQNTLTPEFLDTLKVMSNLGTDIARNLESFKIQAMPEYATIKVKIIKDLQKLGVSSQDILDAAQGVDFQSEQSVAKFYRKFVKPTLSETLDEFVYMNILSSPLTHIVNAASNIVQLVGLNPITKLASGSIDYVASKLTGKDREHYVKEVPEFYKGALNAFPKAFKGAAEAIQGKKNLERPDVKHLPTLSPLVDWGTLKVGKYVIRALEASDVLFRTMIEAGEVQALSKNLGHEPSEKELLAIKKKAKERADYYVFRQKPDAENKSGQGDALAAIDQLTNAIYRVRAVPGFKWFIRFVQTPMNIAKQGIEYSPAGFATLKGASDKSEQAGKAAIGSLVFAGAAWLAANGNTTWSAPKGDREKNDFYAAGLQPYSVRVGDKWVSYSKIGILAYPLAMAAALHYFTKESPNALTDSEMDKLADGLTGIMSFFSDQSYMQGLGDLVKFSSGEKSKAISSIPSQMVPLSSLQGWVNNVIDPLQRKAEKGLTINSVLDNIQMKIIGMSEFVPPQIDSEEVPVKKQLKEINAVSPLKMSQVDQGKLAEYKDNQRTKQEINKLKKELS